MLKMPGNEKWLYLIIIPDGHFGIKSAGILFISSIENLQYTVLFILLTKYSTILQIQYKEEQDIMSTLWLEGGKEKKQN